MCNFNIVLSKAPVIYSKTSLFLNSAYCKGNVGKNNRKLKQNNTGLYFESIIKSKLNNLIAIQEYKKVDGSIYVPDIETVKSIISCKVQEGPGTAWQKLIFEVIDLENLRLQTNKKVILLVSDYSWNVYFYKLKSYVNKINCNIEICTESFFTNNIKNYD